MIGERLYHVCDTTVAALGTTITTTVTALIAVVRPYNPEDQLWQGLLPLIGVTLVGFGAVMLNPATEVRRIVMGRAAIGGFFGWIAPSISIAIAPNILPEWALWIVDVLRWPMCMMGVGGVVTGVIYILSRPLFANAYDRADAISKAQIKRLEEFAKGPHNTVIVLDPSKVKAPATEEPDSK